MNPLAFYMTQIIIFFYLLLNFLAPSHAIALAAHRNYEFAQPNPLTKQWIVTHFGDSIAAGYCGIGCVLDSYVQYYAYKNPIGIAQSQGVHVIGRIFATTGDTSEQVVREINEKNFDIRLADVITVEACGNDYLPSRRQFRKTCNLKVIESALETCKINMREIINMLVFYARPGARIRVMNIYYPGLNKDLQKGCGGKKFFDSFLPILVEGNWYTCDYALKNNVICLDAFALMNASDEDQQKIVWIPGESLESYQTRLLITYKNLLTDPSQKKTSQGIISLMQSDDIHPNKIGHQRLGLLHHLAGYASSK